MNKCGERLRQTRETTGLSLAQVAIETRILQQSLVALEAGAYELLPGDVVVKGFIRNYAHFLGLTADELIELYRQDRGGTSPVQVASTTTMTPQRSYVLPGFFGVFFVTLALVGLTYVALSAVGRIGNAQIASRGTPAAVSVTVATPTPLTMSTPSGQPVASGAVEGTEGMTAPRTPTPSPRPAGYAMRTPEAHPTPAAPIAVEVTIKPGEGDSWLRVKVDGATSYEQIMRAGEQEIFYAQRQIEIRAGNPTAVNVSVNGSLPEPLGTIPGRPVNWSWPPL